MNKSSRILRKNGSQEGHEMKTIGSLEQDEMAVWFSELIAHKAEVTCS